MRENEGAIVPQKHDTQRLKIDATHNLEVEKMESGKSLKGAFIAPPGLDHRPAIFVSHLDIQPSFLSMMASASACGGGAYGG